MKINGSNVKIKNSSSLLNMEDKEFPEDGTDEPDTSGRKLLYKVDEVPPTGILISVALQVIVKLLSYACADLKKRQT